MQNLKRGDFAFLIWLVLCAMNRKHWQGDLKRGVCKVQRVRHTGRPLRLVFLDALNSDRLRCGMPSVCYGVLAKVIHA